jgi:hypothetical protein
MGANSSSSLPSSSLREAHDPVAKSMHWSGISLEWSSCGYGPSTSPSPAILQQHVASWMDMSPPTRSSERPARTTGGGLSVCRTLDWHGCTGGIGTSGSSSSETAGTADGQGGEAAAATGRWGQRARAKRPPMAGSALREARAAAAVAAAEAAGGAEADDGARAAGPGGTADAGADSLPWGAFGTFTDGGALVSRGEAAASW